jgi:threonine synthase
VAELVSTRDLSQEPVSYTHAVTEGLAPDGGLYVLDKAPVFSLGELQALQDKPFEVISATVQAKLIDGEISVEELAEMAAQAYSEDKFPDTANGHTVPIRQIGDKLWEEQLYKGPTGAFKDVALQFLVGQMLPRVLKSDQVFRIVGASSGDTYSSAEHPIKGQPNMEGYMITPREGMTRFQEAQGAQLSGGNIHNLRINGSFDDAQQLVKELKRDEEFADVGAVNSINVGRIFAQVAYTVSGYLQLMKETGQAVGQPIDVAIPTGNFGNTYSVFLAKEMGVPIRDIIVATNENNLMDHLIQTGEYIARERTITSSPSMDIAAAASNYERLLWDMVGRDPDAVRRYMEEFARNGRVALSDFGLEKAAFADLGISSGMSTHEDRVATIGEVYAESAVVIDPHTADAVTVAQRRDSDLPRLIFGTADPVKSEPVIHEALGFVPEREERFKGIEKYIRPDSFTTIDVSVEALKQYIRSYTAQSPRRRTRAAPTVLPRRSSSVTI